MKFRRALFFIRDHMLILNDFIVFIVLNDKTKKLNFFDVETKINLNQCRRLRLCDARSLYFFINFEVFLNSFLCNH